MKTTQRKLSLFVLSLLLVFAFALSFSSCATVKARDEAKNVEFTPEEEYYIGRAVAANILTSYSMQTGRSGLISYLNLIGNALAINSDKPDILNGYHVNILDDAGINAFATPGGHIFVTRGLIDCAASEDTLAAVIAHEIAHVQLGHGLGAIEKSRLTDATIAGLRKDYQNVKTGLSAASALGLDQLLEDATGAPITGITSAVSSVDTAVQGVQKLVNVFGLSIEDIVTTMINNGYSREQEFEADAAALVILARTGYEPDSLLEMLRVLEKNQGAHPGGFNKTHPSPAERIASAQKAVANNAAGGPNNVKEPAAYRASRFAGATR